MVTRKEEKLQRCSFVNCFSLRKAVKIFINIGMSIFIWTFYFRLQSFKAQFQLISADKIIALVFLGHWSWRARVLLRPLLDWVQLHSGRLQTGDAPPNVRRVCARHKSRIRVLGHWRASLRWVFHSKNCIWDEKYAFTPINDAIYCCQNPNYQWVSLSRVRSWMHGCILDWTD